MSEHLEFTPTGSEDLENSIATSSIHSMKSDDWWVITGQQIDLPKVLPSGRPEGTKNLLICADKIRIYDTAILTDWSDVVVICTNFEQYGNSNFRREKAVIDDSEEPFRFAFFSQTLEQFPQDKYKFWLELPAEVTVKLRYDNRPRVDYIETVIVRARPNGRGYLALPSQLQTGGHLPNSFLERLLLTAQYLIDEQHTEDANRFLELLDTILALDNGATSWQELAPQIAATHEVLKFQLPGSNRVPDLNPAVYAGVAEAYGPALKAFADEFQQFVDRNADIKLRREAAERILSKEADIIRFQDLVKKQLTENLEKATDNVTTAEASMKSQSRRVEASEIRFNAGLRAWQRQQEREAAIAIARAAFSFISGVAQMLTGNPKGAEETAKAANAVAKAATKVETLVKLMKEIAKIVERVAKLVMLSQKLAEAIRKFPNSKQFADSMADVRREAESNLDDAPSDNAYWDQLWLEVEIALAPAAHISGAAEYLKELKVMIIYGRALTTAQATIPPIVQELARAALLTELAEEQRKAVEKEIEKLQAGKPASAMTSVSLWLNHRSVQSTMVSALQDFDAAHRYWALEVTPTPPHSDPRNSFTEIAGDLLAVANLKRRHQKALESLRPRPQDFSRRAFIVPDTAITDFLRDGSFALNFTPEFGPLKSWGDIGRVRVHEVAVWIIWNEGKQPGKGEMEFTIRTNGDYYDQRVVSGEMQRFRFTIDPVNLSFRYDPAIKDRKESIIVAGKIAEDFRDLFTEPTLFTEWRFSLPAKYEDDDIIDLEDLQDAVSGIRLEFSGKYIKDDNRLVDIDEE